MPKCRPNRLMQCTASPSNLSRCSGLVIIFQFLVVALNFAVIQYIFYWHIAFVVVAAVRTIASSDLNTWINRGVLVYIRHIIVFQRVEQTAERRFLTLNKQTKMRDIQSYACSFTQSLVVWHFFLLLLIPVVSSAYIVVGLSLIFVYFLIASCFIINA